MSKLKIGDKVFVKATGKTGIVKGREVINTGEGKVKIEYVVKTDDGFIHWASYTKNELKKVVQQPKQKELQKLVIEAPKGYKVTLVAILQNHRIIKDSLDEYGMFYSYVRKGKDLKIGYSIYNPSDEYDEKLGVKIAANRAKKSPFCHLISDFNGEFNKETIEALLKVKGEYIVKNIEKFIV